MKILGKLIICRIAAELAKVARSRERGHARHNQEPHKQGRDQPALDTLTALLVTL